MVFNHQSPFYNTLDLQLDILGQKLLREKKSWLPKRARSNVTPKEDALN